MLPPAHGAVKGYRRKTPMSDIANIGEAGRPSSLLSVVMPLTMLLSRSSAPSGGRDRSDDLLILYGLLEECQGLGRISRHPRAL